MSRIRSVAAAASDLNRRTLLAATGAVTISAGIGIALRPGSDAQAATGADTAANTSAAGTGEAPVAVSRQAPVDRLNPYSRGTTLSSVATPAPVPPDTGGSATAPAGSGPYAATWPRPRRAGRPAAPRSPRSCSSPTCT